MKLRERVWRRLATDLKSDKLHDIKKSFHFQNYQMISTVLNHDNFGRIIIDFDA